MFSFLKRLFGGSQTDLTAWLDRDALIIDVRTPAEFKGGHVPKSINIPLDQVKGQLKKIKGYGKPVVACCASGNRSGVATQLMRGAGIEVINGGGWRTVDTAVRNR